MGTAKYIEAPRAFRSKSFMAQSTLGLTSRSLFTSRSRLGATSNFGDTYASELADTNMDLRATDRSLGDTNRDLGRTGQLGTTRDLGATGRIGVRCAALHEYPTHKNVGTGAGVGTGKADYVDREGYDEVWTSTY